MRRLAVVLVVGLVAGCANTPSSAPVSPSPSPAPASPPSSPSAALPVTISVGCGAVSSVSDCLAMVAAAASVVSLSAVPGVRAEVATATTADLTCSYCLGGIVLVAASVVGRVTFTTPSGSSGSAWVITKPIPGYAGVVAINGVTPPPVVAASPAPGANGPEPTGTIAIDCGTVTDVSDCVAMVAGASMRLTPSDRAEVSKGATPDVTAVTFVSPTGARDSIWVIPNPIGSYTGVWSINGVTPPP